MSDEHGDEPERVVSGTEGLVEAWRLRLARGHEWRAAAVVAAGMTVTPRTGNLSLSSDAGKAVVGTTVTPPTENLNLSSDAGTAVVGPLPELLIPASILVLRQWRSGRAAR